MMGVSAISMAPQVARRLRNPVHKFHVRHAPYVIQPFFIAPVLPGETLENLSFQSRALTQPIVNPLIGWWIEYYFFYCKHRDLADSAIFQTMMLDAAATLTSAVDYKTAAALSQWSYFKGTGMDWVQACAKAIIPAYFRDQGDAYDSITIDGNPAAYLDGRDWMESMKGDTVVSGFDVSIPVDATPTPDVVLASDVEAAMAQYTLLRMQGLTEATYEDWLRSYGVRTQAAVVNKPELVRYVREWSYPSSHVQPNATTPSLSDVTSAVSWSVAERADKPRFFKEPGFLVGLTCSRPKVYSLDQQQPAVSLMNDAFRWLPALLLDQPDISRVTIADDANSILGTAIQSARNVDIKDLLIYGDQFLGGLALTETDVNKSGAGQGVVMHTTQAAVDGLFASGDATGGVRQDGIVRLSIMSAQRDTSPRGSVTAGGAA